MKNMKKNTSSQTGKGLKMTTNAVPAAKNVNVSAVAPIISNRDGVCHIIGQEQIATINGSVTFNAEQFKFNPGLTTYSWLSLQAVGWEKYRVKQLEFVYVPAEAVTTTPGTIYLAYDYDPSDAAPSSLASISTYESQSSGRVFEALSCYGRPDRMHDGVQKKKVRTGPVGGDLMLYDACTINVATVSCSDTSALGQLWVYYDIEFYSRQVEPTLRISPSMALFGNTTQTLTTTVAATLDYDVEIVNGLGVVSDGAGTYTLEPGSYIVTGVVEVSDSANETFSVLTEIQVNGASTSPAQTNYVSMSAGSAVQQLEVNFIYYVSSADSFTMRLRVTATGAAGTLTVANRCKLLIQAL